ncbi:MAG: CapA family protein [Clostridia bacterium]|nr:CapA family protein [Clostridia bacterium]
MSKVKILFAGDFCVRGEGTKNLTDDRINEVSGAVKNVTDSYDFLMVNVETVFTDELSPVKKSGPALASPTKALELLSKMNFGIAALANNHVCDQGESKSLKSKKMLEDAGMLTIGCGQNLDEANKPVRVEKNGIKISFLNFAENEFTAATKSSYGFAPVDYYDNARIIKSEKEASDFVFVMLHAGSEYCPFPRTGVRKLSYHLVESGADAVIISHPHTVQGYEYHCGKPIIYSMGNFFMSKRSADFSLWNLGYMADITIHEDRSVVFTPIPYEFASYGEYFKVLEADRKQKFLTYLRELSAIIEDTDEEEYKNLEYAWSVFYMRLAWDGFLQEMLKDKSPDGELMLYIKNAFCCETHNEVLKNFFTIYTTNRINEFEDQLKKIKSWQKMPF